ncbi:MAG: hypothetical protein HGB31_07775 [Erysipelotrichaceae bacterium]|nr:hypothetical protein [Erysipelotrichaceae bacterium]
MNKKNFLVLGFILIIVYIAYLKTVGLNTIDMNNLLESIRPYLLHSIFLMGAFVFNLLAIIKKTQGFILGSALLCGLSALTYFPMSLIMLVPGLVLAYTYLKLK